MHQIRTFEQTELTKTIVAAIKRAIKTVEPFAATTAGVNQRDELRLYKELLERIEQEHMDLRMSSRLE